MQVQVYLLFSLILGEENGTTKINIDTKPPKADNLRKEDRKLSMFYISTLAFSLFEVRDTLSETERDRERKPGR